MAGISPPRPVKDRRGPDAGCGTSPVGLCRDRYPSLRGSRQDLARLLRPKALVAPHAPQPTDAQRNGAEVFDLTIHSSKTVFLRWEILDRGRHMPSQPGGGEGQNTIGANFLKYTKNARKPTPSEPPGVFNNEPASRDQS